MPDEDRPGPQSFERRPRPEPVVRKVVDAAPNPLGPKGPPVTLPFTEYRSFNILQVTRDDLVAWLSAARPDFDVEVLRVYWKDGSDHIYGMTRKNPRKTPASDLPANIEQVEEVRSIAYRVTYTDKSKLDFQLNRGSASLRYAAEKHNSFAQRGVFAVRNLIDRSEAVRKSRFYLLPVVPILIGTLVSLGLGVVASAVINRFKAPGTSMISSDTAVIITGTALLAVLFVALAMIRLSRLKTFSSPGQVTDPLAVTYPTRTKWTAGKVWALIGSIVGFLGAIAAIVVVFYAPK